KLVLVLDLQVSQLRIDGGRNVAGQRPRRCRPDQEVLAGPTTERETDEDRAMSDILITFVHLHLAQADRTTRTPGHGIVAAINQFTVVTLLEEAPDRVVVLLGHR